MSRATRLTVVALAALVGQCTAGYSLEDDYSAGNFFSMFDFFTYPDPTHGFVNYVDQGTAQAAGLIHTNGSSVYMGVDSYNIAPNGRNSVRLTSNKVYNHGLIILDVAHMPEGCGTWPAFWTVGPNWPESGEIDIIEGVNDQAFNAMTLHTSPGCSITNNGQFSGNIITPSCDVNAPGQPANAGCSIDASSGSNTYGSGLNSIGGGVYATEWTSNHISVYFFPRSSIPSDITSGNPSPSGWGKPLAQFQGGCNIDSTFKNQQIVFDTTFCGDWAGNAWWSSSCSARSSSCTDFVANNPSAFANAYWSINSLKVYQSSGDTAPESSASAGPTGIASGLPSIISSLAPIPVQTTFAVSVKPSSTAASSTTGLAVVPPGVLDPKSSKTSSSKTSSSKTSSSKTSSSKSTSSKHSTTTSHKSSETHHSSSKTSETHHHHHHHSSSKSSTKHHSSTRATVHSVAPVPASSTSPAAHSTSKPAASSSTTLRLLQFSDFPSPSHATSSPNAPPPQATPSIQPLQFGWFPSGGGEGGIPVADTYQTSYKEKRDASPSPDASSSDDNDNLDVEAEMIWRRQRKEQMEQEAESLRKTKKHRRFLGKAHGGGGLKHAHFHH